MFVDIVFLLKTHTLTLSSAVGAGCPMWVRVPSSPLIFHQCWHIEVGHRNMEAASRAHFHTCSFLWCHIYSSSISAFWLYLACQKTACVFHKCVTVRVCFMYETLRSLHVCDSSLDQTVSFWTNFHSSKYCHRRGGRNCCDAVGSLNNNSWSFSGVTTCCHEERYWVTVGHFVQHEGVKKSPIGFIKGPLYEPPDHWPTKQ